MAQDAARRSGTADPDEFCRLRMGASELARRALGLSLDPDIDTDGAVAVLASLAGRDVDRLHLAIDIVVSRAQAGSYANQAAAILARTLERVEEQRRGTGVIRSRRSLPLPTSRS